MRHEDRGLTVSGHDGTPGFTTFAAVDRPPCAPPQRALWGGSLTRPGEVGDPALQGVVEDDPKGEALAASQAAHPVAHGDAIGPARPLRRALANGEDDAVALA